MNFEEENINPDLNNQSEEESDTYSLILYNDDINSFEFVIESLIDICEFEDIPAEQLTLLAHFKGKSTIKIGDKIYLSALKEQFEELGLTVEVV